VAESAFVVRVPEAEPYVSHLRQQFDPAAKLGMPAHITLLFPFASPELIDTAVVAQARAVVAGVHAFAFSLVGMGRFPDVLYLVPEPSGPFVALTERLVRQFPDFPPYGGQYQSVVPHLTVAHGGGMAHSRAEAELRSTLSASGAIACSVREVVLMGKASGQWREMQVFPLGGIARAGG
jgi:2'-5' RNA ligase